MTYHDGKYDDHTRGCTAQALRVGLSIVLAIIVLGVAMFLLR